MVFAASRWFFGGAARLLFAKSCSNKKSETVLLGLYAGLISRIWAFKFLNDVPFISHESFVFTSSCEIADFQGCLARKPCPNKFKF